MCFFGTFKKPVHKASLVEMLIQPHHWWSCHNVGCNFFPLRSIWILSNFFLLRLIDHIQNKDAEQWKGVFYICILFVSNIVWTLSCHMSLHNSVIVGIQMRSSVVSVLYRKSLKISNKARAQFTIGEITNYMRYVNIGNSLISPLLI